MRSFRKMATLAVLLGMSSWAHGDAELISGFPQILVTTSEGEFVIELEAGRAPITASRFHQLVADGFYDNTIFHRVEQGFVIQGGGYFADMTATASADRLVNESGNGLSNERGTIAMARENAPHTATSQFYINIADNGQLDPSPERWGYAVFGRVVAGMDTIDAIAAVPVGNRNRFANVPAMPVTIKSARILSAEDIEARSQAELEKAEKELEALTQ